MQTKIKSHGFSTACFLAVALSIFFITASLLVYYFLPNSAHTEDKVEIVDLSEETEVIDTTETDIANNIQSVIMEVSLEGDYEKRDSGLDMYSQPLSKSATEWFYYQVTGDKDVTLAILSEAAKNEIPLSLAFALAYAESNYKVTAVNRNTNGTIDRGLFQLNSGSFPTLSEAEFFDPYTSAKHGMQHLRFCINKAGNEVAGLAMYNAGTNKVRSNRTPQSTLNYINKIFAYRQKLDELFEEQVCPYFEPLASPIAVACK